MIMIRTNSVPVEELLYYWHFTSIQVNCTPVYTMPQIGYKLAKKTNTHTCTHARMHTYTHTCTHTHRHTVTTIHTHTHTRTHTHTDTHAHRQADTQTHAHTLKSDKKKETNPESIMIKVSNWRMKILLVFCLYTGNL